MARRQSPTDLSVAEGKRIEPIIPSAKPCGRPRTINVREVMTAIFAITRPGCGWRILPHDFLSGKRCASSTLLVRRRHLGDHERSAAGAGASPGRMEVGLVIILPGLGSES
ncbi:MAG: transposase [Planctomycetaceae bacterium]|nr:transposase [Planctomycetaceae bacterium]